MILPIRAFGDAVLRKKAQEIDKDYPELKDTLLFCATEMISREDMDQAADIVK